MKDDEKTTPERRAEPADDYEAWIQSRKDLAAPPDFGERIMAALPDETPMSVVKEPEEEEGRFGLVKAAVLVGAALVGISRMAAVFIWILMP